MYLTSAIGIPASVIQTVLVLPSAIGKCKALLASSLSPFKRWKTRLRVALELILSLFLSVSTFFYSSTK